MHGVLHLNVVIIIIGKVTHETGFWQFTLFTYFTIFDNQCYSIFFLWNSLLLLDLESVLYRDSIAKSKTKV